MTEKYKYEIEEILKRAEAAMPKGRRSRAGRTQQNQDESSSSLGFLTGGRGLKISAGKLMLTGFGLLLLAMILAAAGIAGMAPIVIVGLVLFVIAYALFFIRPSMGFTEKRWRGRPIEGNTPRILDRFRRWLNRR